MFGVPGALGEELDWPQPDREIKPLMRNKVKTTERKPFRMSRRFGKNRSKPTLMKAIPCRGLGTDWCAAALEGAVVVIVSLPFATKPLAGVTEAGVKEQAAPPGSVPQVKFTIPLYPPIGVMVSVATTD